jgi:hypothetical protein
MSCKNLKYTLQTDRQHLSGESQTASEKNKLVKVKREFGSQWVFSLFKGDYIKSRLIK